MKFVTKSTDGTTLNILFCFILIVKQWYEIQTQCWIDMFNFLKKNICSNFVALLVAFIFIISYSMYMYFLVLEIKPSQSNNLISTSYKLTIMTGNNVHFLILKNTKIFANLWWLNLGTESDLSTVWIFYCVVLTFFCSLKRAICF